MKTLSLSVFVLVTCLSTGARGVNMWEVQPAHAGQGWGYSCSLALDSTDRPYVAHYNSSRTDGVLLTQRTASNWVSEVVHPMGLHPSVAVDTNDTPHVSFSVRDWDTSTFGVYHAVPGPGGFQVEPVATNNHQECVTSLELDSTNAVHIGFYDQSQGGLWYSRQVAGAWSTQELDSAASYSSLDLTLNNAGDPCFIYVAGWPYRYMYGCLTGAVWTAEQLPESNAGGFSLAFDPSGDPHVSYGASTRVLHVQRTGGAWQTNEIQAVFGQDTSIVFDSTGTPHVSYYVSGTQGTIYHAKWTGAAWTSEVVAVGPSVYGPTSMALTSNDTPCIAFRDFTFGLNVACLVVDTDEDGMPDYWEDQHNFNKNNPDDADDDPDEDLLSNLEEYRNQTLPRVADTDGDGFNDKAEIDAGTDPWDPQHFPATGWTIEPVASLDAGNAEVTAISLANSTAHVAFVAVDSNITVAVQPTWATEPVVALDQFGGVALDIAHDAAGTLHLVGGPEGDLFYAARNGSWASERLGTNGVGQSSLALDGAGVPHAIYIDSWAWPSEIHVVHRQAPGVWTGEFFSAEHALMPGLAINTAGHPVVSHSFDDGAGWGVRVVTWNGASWDIEVAYTNYASASVLLLDDAGTRHLAFQRGWDVDALMYAAKPPAGGTWDPQPVDEIAASYFSMALDTNGIPHLSYRADPYRELRYAYWDTGASQWRVEIVDSVGDTGYGNDIAVDANGGVHISYTDGTSQQAMYAYRAPAGAADSDGDGLLDIHETGTGTYNGPTDTGTNPDLKDTDGDGNDDYQEVHVLGTDPTDPNSNLQPAAPDIQVGTGVVVQWPSVAGKTYQVVYTTDLMTGPAPLSGLLPAILPTNAYTDTVIRAGATCYGIAVQTGP